MDCVHHPGVDAPYQCFRCREFICVDCESKVEGRSYCRSCMANIHQRLVDQYAAETRNISYGLALLSGLGAAVVVAAIWSQVNVWTPSLIPVWPGLLGGAVGWAIVAGTGKRGDSLQKIAAVIALAGAFVGFFLCAYRLDEYIQLLLDKGLKAQGYTPLSGTLTMFPAYLSTRVNLLDWFFVVVGVVWAWYIPHERTAPS